jgi:hypothetical protein
LWFDIETVSEIYTQEQWDKYNKKKIWENKMYDKL